MFQYNEWIKQNKTKHLGYLFPYRVKHSTISAFNVQCAGSLWLINESKGAQANNKGDIPTRTEKFELGNTE